MLLAISALRKVQRYDHDTTFPDLNIHAESEITLTTRTYPATGLGTKPNPVSNILFGFA
jgi:hypothetical protein